MNPPLKQFADTERHLEILESRGMVIPDRQKANRYIRNIGYFRLSAYWHIYRKIKYDKSGKPIISNGTIDRHDDFVEGTSFEDVLSLYIFDRQLRNVVHDAIQRIEISVRSQIVCTLGPIDRQAHVNRILGCYKSNFLNPFANSLWDKWQERQQKLLQVGARERFIQHEIGKYGNLDNLPIWVAAELWDFGCTQYLYAGLAPRHAESIARFYNMHDSDILISWMKTFNYVRNICAHHRRLWNRRIVNQPKLIRPEDSEYFSHLWTKNGPMNNKVYSVLCILQFLMQSISPRSQWSLKVHDLTANFKEFDQHKAEMGFPEDWKQMSLWG